MANRIKDIAVTATSAAGDDYIVIDGSVNGTRKILATSALAGVTSVAGRTGAVTLSTADISGLGTSATLNAGAANGVATLDASGKLTSGQIPAIAVVSYLGSVGSQAAMLALAGQEGDWCLRSDLGTNWIITGNDPTQLSSWTQLSYPTAPVTSVAGRTGAVTLSTADISGLGTIATQAADSVSITGGVISGLTSLGIASGTVTASSPALNVTQTWNNAGVTFTGIKGNFTNTASGANSLMIDLQVDSSSKFNVSKAGTITLLDTYKISAGGGSFLISHTVGITGWLVVKGYSMQLEGANLGVQMGLVGAMDVAIMRNSAGVLEINNATLGTYRDLNLRNLTASGNVTVAGTINTNSGSAASPAIALNSTANGLFYTGSSVVRVAAGGAEAASISLSTATFTGAISASNLSGTNTGDQTITMTGHVTGSGTGSFATTIAAGVVTNAMLAGSIDLATKVTGTLPVANGGTGATTEAGARTSLGATTAGSNLFTLANPSAVTFLQVNADNTVSALDAATFRSAIGAGTSSTTGTVTSVSGTGTVSGLTLTGTVTSSGSLTLGGTLSVTASNFSSQTANTVLAAPNGSAGTPTFRALVAADIPTLNQNTTGTAANVTGTVAVANGGTGITSLTAGYLPRGNGTSAFQASQIYDSGTNVGVNQASPATRFDLSGNFGQNIVAVGALSIDCSAGNYFTKTIAANSTFTFDSVPASRAFSFTLELTHTSGTITWPTSVKWPGDTAPTLTTGKTHLFMFVTDDGGTRWRGSALTNFTN